MDSTHECDRCTLVRHTVQVAGLDSNDGGTHTQKTPKVASPRSPDTSRIHWRKPCSTSIRTSPPGAAAAAAWPAPALAASLLPAAASASPELPWAPSPCSTCCWGWLASCVLLPSPGAEPAASRWAPPCDTPLCWMGTPACRSRSAMAALRCCTCGRQKDDVWCVGPERSDACSTMRAGQPDRKVWQDARQLPEQQQHVQQLTCSTCTSTNPTTTSSFSRSMLPKKRAKEAAISSRGAPPACLQHGRWWTDVWVSVPGQWNKGACKVLWTKMRCVTLCLAAVRDRSSAPHATLQMHAVCAPARSPLALPLVRGGQVVCNPQPSSYRLKPDAPALVGVVV